VVARSRPGVPPGHAIKVKTVQSHSWRNHVVERKTCATSCKLPIPSSALVPHSIAVCVSIVMSHEDISSAWSVLSGRQDIDHIVRELIGNHYLNASFAQRDSSHLREAILSHVLTLKITFDLQRSYLQSSEPSKESTCSTLQPDSISTAVFHLLDVVLATCTSCPGLAIEESFIRLTAQTTLSSLRVLLLLNKSFAAWEHDLLQSRFEEVYQRGHWHDSSQALILSICRHIIQALASPTQYRKYTVPACGAASLPDFFTGLVSCFDSKSRTYLSDRHQYVFQGHSRSAVDASLSNPGVSLHSANWFHDCLVLYDLQWSTTAALIQLCAARRRRQETKTGWSEVDQARELSDFRLVLATRFQLQQQILYAVGMRTTAHWTAEQLRTLLCQDLCAACAEDRCQCFQGDWSVIEDLVRPPLGFLCFLELTSYVITSVSSTECNISQCKSLEQSP
jgi:hypothetical protein